MGGKASYDFQDKNYWRRWWCNQFAERQGGNRSALRTKTVLYLCADDGGESELLVDRGFSRENLYACDLSAGNSTAHRKRGGNAITGDFHTAVRVWPNDVPLNCIAADLCCPLSRSAVDLSVAILTSPGLCEGMTIGVNLSRGRDEWSNTFRSYVNGPRFLPFTSALGNAAGVPSKIIKTHRGLQWYINFWSAFTPAYLESEGQELVDSEVAHAVTAVHNAASPRCYSYMSGSLAMDSVVFDFPLSGVGDVGRQQLSKSTQKWCDIRSKRSVHGSRLNVTRPRIAAMRAVLRREMTANRR